MNPLPQPVSINLFVFFIWIFVGALGYPLLQKRETLLKPLALLLSIGSILLAYSAFLSLLSGTDYRFTVEGGLPGLLFHLHLDPLSSFFLLILGGAGTGVLLFSGGSLHAMSPRKKPGFFLNLSFFMASMEGVFLADDAYLFMIFWEAMALFSTFLVLTDRDRSEVRDAGYLYLLMAHFGSLLIMMGFFFLASREPSGQVQFLESLTFNAMATSTPSTGLSFLIFLLVLLGFGAKAGLIPLHVWLPRAHPAAPTPASALLSGIMLKTALYGIIRLLFGLLGLDHLSATWGIPLLLTGGLMALFGILHALLQSNPKKLLAYSSIENIGILFLGVGLAILYFKSGHPVAGEIALGAVLYHAINHAFFKTLLFLGAGTIIHASRTNDLNAMGGLLRRMPVSGGLVLAGILFASGLPPGNGFVSEWLLLQSTLQAWILSNTLFRSAVLLGAALLVLASALSAMGFVKFFGIGYLGIPRSEEAGKAHEVSFLELTGMGWLAGGCLLLAALPLTLLKGINHVIRSLTGHVFPDTLLSGGWIWIRPISAHGASYSPPLLLALLLAALPLPWVLLRLLRKPSTRTSPAWGCGYSVRTPRMQDTADAFGQPIRHFFPFFFAMKRRIPAPDEKDPLLELSVEDPHWPYLFRPLLRLFVRFSELADRVRTGRISVYLVYSFVTLLFLLSVLRWM